MLRKWLGQKMVRARLIDFLTVTGQLDSLTDTFILIYILQRDMASHGKPSNVGLPPSAVGKKGPQRFLKSYELVNIKHAKQKESHHAKSQNNDMKVEVMMTVNDIDGIDNINGCFRSSFDLHAIYTFDESRQRKDVRNILIIFYYYLINLIYHAFFSWQRKKISMRKIKMWLSIMRETVLVLKME